MNFSTKDLTASLVVFLVALPLCLGIASISGAPPLSGVIAGIVGGIVVGSLSGSRVGVSGPAAGLAVIVFEAIQEFGGLDGGGLQILLAATVVAGGIQIALGLLRAGVIAYFFPNAVIKGMLAGIGVVIFVKELSHAVGYDKDPEGDDNYVQADGETTTSGVLTALEHIDPGAVIISAVGLVLIVLFNSDRVKRIPVVQFIPGALMAVVSGVVLYFVFRGTGLEISPEHTVSIQVTDVASLFTFPSWSAIGTTSFWVTAVTLAIIASVETLLCVEATDKLDPQRPVTDTNRELLAQGVGNAVSGFIGGLPVTQVIVRSSANLQAEASSKASAIIHGVWLLLAVFFFSEAMNYIPRASLAAVLLVVGYKLANPKNFVAQFRKGWTQFLPFVITVAAIYFINLLWGIGIGLAVSIIFLLYRNLVTPYFTPEEAADNSGDVVLHLSEHVSFLNKARIRQKLSEIEPGANVVIDATNSRTIDQDVIEVFDDFRIHAADAGIGFTYLPPRAQPRPAGA